MLSDDEKELLDGVEDDKAPKGWSNTTKTVAAVLLSVVMATYIYLFPTLYDAILGWTQSEVVINKTVSGENATIVFSDQVLNNLYDIYGEFPDEETALCMNGSKNRGTYRITSFTQPRIYSQSYGHVNHAPCPNTTLVVFHTQPQRQCLPSGTDRETLRTVQQRNDDSIMLIMCAPNRFTVVTDPDGAI